jgi:hypothetical protein
MNPRTTTTSTCLKTQNRWIPWTTTTAVVAAALTPSVVLTVMLTLLQMPSDLLGEIVSYAGIRTLCTCAATCKELRAHTQEKLDEERKLYERLRGDLRISMSERDLLRLDLTLCYVCDRMPSHYMHGYHVATRSDPVMHTQGHKFYDQLLSLLLAKYMFEARAMGFEEFNEFHVDFSKIQQLLVFSGEYLLSEHDTCVRILTSCWETAGLNVLISVLKSQSNNPKYWSVWENPGWCLVTPEGLLYQVEGLEVPETQLQSIQQKSVADLVWFARSCLVCYGAHTEKKGSPLCCDRCQPLMRKAEFAVMLRSRGRRKRKRATELDEVSQEQVFLPKPGGEQDEKSAKSN